MISATQESPYAVSEESRREARKNVQILIDVKPLKTQDVDNILFGQGFEDLNSNSLSMARPRHGMERAETADISLSGLRLKGVNVKRGTAVVVDLHLPDESVVIKALMEVVWTKDEGSQASAGCRFAAIQESGADRMRSFIRRA
jgi:hypothetical protein